MLVDLNPLHEHIFPLLDEPSIRLVGGNSLSNGQVEIGFERQFWGGICHTGWSYEDATVLCRMLGFERGLPTFSSTFGLGVHRSWLSSVNCIGEEKSILDCVKSGWNVPCTPSVRAGVICLGASCDLCSCNINIIPINHWNVYKLY